MQTLLLSLFFLNSDKIYFSDSLILVPDKITHIVGVFRQHAGGNNFLRPAGFSLKIQGSSFSFVLPELPHKCHGLPVPGYAHLRFSGLSSLIFSFFIVLHLSAFLNPYRNPEALRDISFPGVCTLLRQKFPVPPERSGRTQKFPAWF